MSETDFIVAWSGRSEQEIDRELKRLDPDLYLDMELDYQGGPVYYVVKHNTGSGVSGQVTVLVWKNGDGMPRPLTHELVELVKRRDGALDGALDRVLEAERERRERARKQSRDDHAAVLEEHLPRIRAAEGRTLPPGWRPKRFGAK